jgi:hypothetical protein
MKIHVLHDKNGAIESVVVLHESRGKRVTVEPEPGLEISEVEAPEGSDPGDKRLFEGLGRRYRIEGTPPHRKLVPL